MRQQGLDVRQWFGKIIRLTEIAKRGIFPSCEKGGGNAARERNRYASL